MMTIEDCVERIASIKPDNRIAEKLHKFYGVEMPDLVVQIVTLFEDGGFVENYRFLSLNEIAYAEEDLNVPFKSIRVIPLVDCGDNDFIAYSFFDEVWLRYNIVEEVGFGKRKQLNEVLK